METESRRPKDREEAISALNAAIEALDLVEKSPSIRAAKTVFGSISYLLRMIRGSMVNEMDHVELGLLCADVCQALDKGVDGKSPDELSQSVYDAINLLTLTVADLQRRLVKWSKRGPVSRRLHAESDKETIATWKVNLDKILHVFSKELAVNVNVADSTVHHDVVNTHVIASNVPNDIADTRITISDNRRNVLRSTRDARDKERMSHASAPGQSLRGSTHGIFLDIHQDAEKTRAMTHDIDRDMLKSQDEADDQHRSIQASTLGEPPPPAPKACFGRGGLIVKIIGLAESLTPIALVGVGGIGKTSIALTALHHDRIKRRFGDNRRFVRCDQFVTSCAHFLSRLSEVVGADIENPEDFAALRPFLSSKEMFIVLDNAESILDPRGADAEEIYTVVEELGRLSNICICITSRISTIPPDCEILDVPALSIGAARGAFYRIYKNSEQPSLVDDILDQLNFHPLSITLLATVGHHNKWDADRLNREWGTRRTSVPRTEHNKSLAAAIELSLASPTFQNLGPDARALLGVVAFFPQGVCENSFDWLFPAIPNGTVLFDKFCILSLTCRSNGFVTMLAPLRDYLSPQDPMSSSLLCTIKERYFTRMSVDIDLTKPSFGESRWILAEDANVEHLLDVFATIDATSDSVWQACFDFMTHLIWHKPRLVILKSKIEELPDDHCSKPGCLFQLSRLSGFIGNQVERRRLLTHTLKLLRERRSKLRLATALVELSDSNQVMDLHQEGIPLAREALEILERLGDTLQQALCLIRLTFLLYGDKQLDAAEEAASRAIDLLPKTGQQFLVCQSHRALGKIHQSKGETEKAIHHFELALGIASPLNWHGSLFWVHHHLAVLYLDEDRFDEAHTHVEQAKSHAVDNTYNLGWALELQAMIWYKQDRFKEARSEALRAADVYEKLGATKEVGDCRKLLRRIQKELNSLAASGQPDPDAQEIK